MRVQLMPSRTARLRYRLSGRAPKVTMVFVLALGIVGAGVWQWPAISAFQESVFAKAPTIVEVNEETPAEWQELVEVRASTRTLYEKMDLTDVDARAVDEYLSAALRADVLVKNNSRTVDALRSAITELTTAFSKLESAVALRDNPVDADAATSTAVASVFCTAASEITFKAQGDGDVALTVGGRGIAESKVGATKVQITVAVDSGRYVATATAKAGVTITAEWSGSCATA